METPPGPLLMFHAIGATEEEATYKINEVVKAIQKESPTEARRIEDIDEWHKIWLARESALPYICQGEQGVFGLSEIVSTVPDLVDCLKDAMDMALCVFDPKTRELQFAGAHNPLYHIRDGVLTEIKADKMPVGINAIEEESFLNHSMQLNVGDTVYIFSDGYVDQFGGPEDKKFKYGPFKDLLMGISGKKMETQRETLDRVIEEWKGERPQVDDILIFGIRFL